MGFLAVFGSLILRHSTSTCEDQGRQDLNMVSLVAKAKNLYWIHGRQSQMT